MRAVNKSLRMLLFLMLHVGCMAQQLVIQNVNLISMEDERLMQDQDVFVDNGRIIRVGTNLEVPANAKRIDGREKYLIPGLFDMHAHFFYEQGDNKETCELELKLMLAKGITTARIANGDPVYLAARQKLRERTWIGPEMVLTSPQLVGAWPWDGKVFAGICKTPKQADSLVRLYKAQGYDQIKLTFMITPEVYKAIQKTAHDVGIEVVGHVGPLVKLPRALAARQQVEHMDEFIDMLLPDTSYNHGQSVSDVNIWRKAAWATVPYLDKTKILPLVEQVKRAGIYVTPTNHFFYSFFATRPDEAEEKSRDSYAYIPPVLKEIAWDVREHYWSNPPPKESRDIYKELRATMISELWKAGVPLMAGSDSPQWFLVSGFALHSELENLVQSGLTPYAALQAATVNPASFLGFETRTGTITPGKEADLVLLEENPLENIKNTTTIVGVMNQGVWYDKSALDGLLNEAKKLGE